MESTIVSARMSPSKKEAGARVLERLGSNASQAINELYDHIIEHGSLPWHDAGISSVGVTREQLGEAMDWVNGLQVRLSPEFASLSVKEARLQRLGVGQRDEQ